MVMVVRDHSLTTFSKLHKVMGLTEDKMIASMDVKRGQMLLDDILNGGNFGHSCISPWQYNHVIQRS